MSRTLWIRVIATVVIVAAVLFMVRLHYATGETSASGAGSEPAEGRRLAQAMCSECHAVEPNARRAGRNAPDFMAVANLPSTTALALNVFLRSNHRTMPNFIIAPDDADRIVGYILSLKRD